MRTYRIMMNSYSIVPFLFYKKLFVFIFITNRYYFIMGHATVTIKNTSVYLILRNLLY